MTTENFIAFCEHGRIDGVIRGLKDPKVNPDYNGAAICRAAENDKIEVVKLLLQDPRINPFTSNNYVLKIAIAYNNIEIVKLILNKFDINLKSDDFVIEAVIYNRDEILDIFLTYDKDINVNESNNLFHSCAVEEAVKRDNYDVLYVMFKHNKIDLRKYGTHIFKHAACNNHYKLVEDLLDYKSVEINYETDNFYAMRWAIMRNNYEIVKLLIDKLDIDLDKNVKMFLSYALISNSYDVIKVLLDYEITYKSIFEFDNENFYKLAHIVSDKKNISISELIKMYELL